MYFYFYLFYSYTVCSRPADIKKISYFSDTQSKDVFQSTPVACQSTRIQHTEVSVQQMRRTLCQEGGPDETREGNSISFFSYQILRKASVFFFLST